MSNSRQRIEFDHDNQTYNVTLAGHKFEVYGEIENGITPRVAHGTWDGMHISGDCTAAVSGDLWDAIADALDTLTD